MDQATEAKTDTRTCTCYPGDGPVPCTRQHALRDCWRIAVLGETQDNIVALKNRDRNRYEQNLLDYLMRVRNCLEETGVTDKTEMAARRLASWFGYDYDGLRNDRIKGYPQWSFNGIGSKIYHGGKQDLKDLVVELTNIVKSK